MYFTESLAKQMITWLAMTESVWSKSSTSCWKVGLRDGTACQQSLIIVYLINQCSDTESYCQIETSIQIFYQRKRQEQ